MLQEMTATEYQHAARTPGYTVEIKDMTDAHLQAAYQIAKNDIRYNIAQSPHANLSRMTDIGNRAVGWGVGDWTDGVFSECSPYHSCTQKYQYGWWVFKWGKQLGCTDKTCDKYYDKDKLEFEKVKAEELAKLREN